MKVENFWAIVVIATVCAMPMWQQLFLGATFMVEDGGLNITMLSLLQNSLLQGGIPLWNPYILCGQSFAGHANSVIYYPPNYLVAFLSAARYVVLSIYLHSIASGLGCIALARELGKPKSVSLFGAVVFVLCPFLVGEYERYFIVQILAFSPWILLFLIRSFKQPSLTGAAAIMIGLQILCGHHQHVIIQALLIGCIAPWWAKNYGTRAVLKSLVLSHSLAVLIACPCIICVPQNLSQSTRALAAPGYFQVFGTTVSQLPALFLPEIFNQLPTSLTNATYWFPIPFVMLALAGLKSRGAWHAVGLIVLGLFLALINNTPLEGPVTLIFPLYHLTRYRCRYLFLTQLGLLFLATSGLQALAEQKRMRVAWALSILTIIELLIYAMNFNPGYKFEDSLANKDLAQLPNAGFGRHACLPNLHRNTWNWGMISGRYSITGLNALSYRTYEDVMSMAELGEPVTEQNIQPSLNSASVRIGLNPQAPILRMLCLRSTLAVKDRKLQVEAISNPMPRFFLCRKVVLKAEKLERLKYLNSPEFVPWEQAVCHQPLAPMGQPGGPDSVILKEETANQLVFDVTNAGKGPALLVLSETFEEGWRVKVDESAQEVLPINHCLRGVVLPEGNHRVRFFYWPTNFSLSLTISCLGVLLSALIYLWPKISQAKSLQGNSSG